VLRFLGEDALAQIIEEWARFPDTNIGMERVLRALGAKPAHDYKDNSSEVIKQIMGVFGRKRPVVEYVILNRSKRGYLQGTFGCWPSGSAFQSRASAARRGRRR
jgi:hypothetical protein